MGRPWAVGRRIFFAMEPERSHLVAQRLLGLPLPWARIGGAVDDPALETDLAGVRLRNPVGLAAGFDKTLAHLGPLGELGFGYVVGGTITRAPRQGNAKPRIVRHPERGALVNAMGLPNPGAERAARTLARGRRTCPRFVSVADEAIEDAVATVELVAPRADGLELNASCPNVSWGRDRDTEAHLRALVAAIVERASVPLFVKLPPFAEPGEREAVLALAAIAQEAGARGLTCGNTRPVEDPSLAVGRGGLSGRPLWPGTLEAVREVLDATGGELPVNACGGVARVDDVAACLAAGAATVQVYTVLIYEGPRLPGLLTAGLVKGTAAARS
ncbi:MAG: dihydroorotate dehydrogenase 2 [Planctomycetaceae bacterium]